MLRQAEQLPGPDRPVQTHWRIDEEHGCAFLRYRTASEVHDTLLRLTVDPSLVPSRHRIHDLRGIRRQVGTEEVLDLARSAVTLWRDAREIREGRVALLVLDDLAFGLARMFESYADSMVEGLGVPSPKLKIVRSFPGAAEWIGLPADYRDPFGSPEDPFGFPEDPGAD